MKPFYTSTSTSTSTSTVTSISSSLSASTSDSFTQKNFLLSPPHKKKSIRSWNERSLNKNFLTKPLDVDRASQINKAKFKINVSSQKQQPLRVAVDKIYKKNTNIFSNHPIKNLDKLLNKSNTKLIKPLDQSVNFRGTKPQITLSEFTKYSQAEYSIGLNQKNYATDKIAKTDKTFDLLINRKVVNKIVATQSETRNLKLNAQGSFNNPISSPAHGISSNIGQEQNRGLSDYNGLNKKYKHHEPKPLERGHFASESTINPVQKPSVPFNTGRHWRKDWLKPTALFKRVPAQSQNLNQNQRLLKKNPLRLPIQLPGLTQENKPCGGFTTNGSGLTHQNAIFTERVSQRDVAVGKIKPQTANTTVVQRIPSNFTIKQGELKKLSSLKPTGLKPKLEKIEVIPKPFGKKVLVKSLSLKIRKGSIFNISSQGNKINNIYSNSNSYFNSYTNTSGKIRNLASSDLKILINSKNFTAGAAEGSAVLGIGIGDAKGTRVLPNNFEMGQILDYSHKGGKEIYKYLNLKTPEYKEISGPSFYPFSPFLASLNYSSGLSNLAAALPKEKAGAAIAELYDSNSRFKGKVDRDIKITLLGLIDKKTCLASQSETGLSRSGNISNIYSSEQKILNIGNAPSVAPIKVLENSRVSGFLKTALLNKLLLGEFKNKLEILKDYDIFKQIKSNIISNYFLNKIFINELKSFKVFKHTNKFNLVFLPYTFKLFFKSYQNILNFLLLLKPNNSSTVLNLNPAHTKKINPQNYNWSVGSRPYQMDKDKPGFGEGEPFQVKNPLYDYFFASYNSTNYYTEPKISSKYHKKLNWKQNKELLLNLKKNYYRHIFGTLFNKKYLKHQLTLNNDYSNTTAATSKNIYFPAPKRQNGPKGPIPKNSQKRKIFYEIFEGVGAEVGANTMKNILIKKVIKLIINKQPKFGIVFNPSNIFNNGYGLKINMYPKTRVRAKIQKTKALILPLKSISPNVNSLPKFQNNLAQNQMPTAKPRYQSINLNSKIVKVVRNLRILKAKKSGNLFYCFFEKFIYGLHKKRFSVAFNKFILDSRKPLFGDIMLSAPRILYTGKLNPVYEFYRAKDRKSISAGYSNHNKTGVTGNSENSMGSKVTKPPKAGAWRSAELTTEKNSNSKSNLNSNSIWETILSLLKKPNVYSYMQANRLNAFFENIKKNAINEFKANSVVKKENIQNLNLPFSSNYIATANISLLNQKPAFKINQPFIEPGKSNILQSLSNSKSQSQLQKPQLQKLQLQSSRLGLANNNNADLINSKFTFKTPSNTTATPYINLNYNNWVKLYDKLITILRYKNCYRSSVKNNLLFGVKMRTTPPVGTPGLVYLNKLIKLKNKDLNRTIAKLNNKYFVDISLNNRIAYLKKWNLNIFIKNIQLVKNLIIMQKLNRFKIINNLTNAISSFDLNYLEKGGFSYKPSQSPTSTTINNSATSVIITRPTTGSSIKVPMPDCEQGSKQSTSLVLKSEIGTAPTPPPSTTFATASLKAKGAGAEVAEAIAVAAVAVAEQEFVYLSHLSHLKNTHEKLNCFWGVEQKIKILQKIKMLKKINRLIISLPETFTHTPVLPLKSTKNNLGDADAIDLYQNNLSVAPSLPQSLNIEPFGGSEYESVPYGNPKQKPIIPHNLSIGSQLKKNILCNLKEFKQSHKDSNKNTHFLGMRKFISKYNLMAQIGRSQAVVFNFNKIIKRINSLDSVDQTGSLSMSNISILLKYFFQIIGGALISKPVYVYTNNKIIIQLSYYYNKNTYFLNESERSNFFSLLIKNAPSLADNISNVFMSIPKWTFLKSDDTSTPTPHYRDQFLNGGVQRNLNPDPPKNKNKNPHKLSNDLDRPSFINLTKNSLLLSSIFLKKNSNNNLYSQFNREINALTLILEKFFNCSIQLEITRLYYPFLDSNILAQIIGLNGKRFNFEQILKKLTPKIKIRNPNTSSSFKLINFSPKRNNSLISYLAGIKFRVAGRFYKHKIVPRKTVAAVQIGSLSRGAVNFVDRSRYTNKSQRGSFSITVNVSHIF